jgi:hypothetical protein
MTPPDRPGVRLAAELRLLRVEAGNPTLRQLESRTANAGYPVSRSTIRLIFNGRVPEKWQQLEALVLACESDPARWKERWRIATLAKEAGHALPPRLAEMVLRLSSADLDDRVFAAEALGAEIRQRSPIPRYADGRVLVQSGETPHHWPIVTSLLRLIRERATVPGSDNLLPPLRAPGAAHADVQAAVESIAYRSRCGEPEPPDLSMTDLRGVRIPRAWFPRACLTGCWLENCELIEAHLEKSSLSAARLSWANLRRAHLQGADLENAQAQFAVLVRADMRGARLVGTDLAGARTEGVDWRDAVR